MSQWNQPLQPPHDRRPQPPGETDDERMLREIEQDLKEEERGEVPPEPTSAGLWRGALVVVSILVFGGLFAGVAFVEGTGVRTAAMGGGLGGLFLGQASGKARLIPGADRHTGYDGVAVLAVMAILFLAVAFIWTTGLLAVS